MPLRRVSRWQSTIYASSQTDHRVFQDVLCRYIQPAASGIGNIGSTILEIPAQFYGVDHVLFAPITHFLVQARPIIDSVGE